MKVVIDTGIFINILNKEHGYEYSVEFLNKIRKKEIEGFISVATIAEIVSLFYKISERDTSIANAYIESIIGKDKIVPIVRNIAELAGRIKSSYKISLGDAFIVATAVLMGCDYMISQDPEIKKIDLIDVKGPKEFL